MNKIIAAIVEKVGISEAQAHKVIDVLKEHADELPSLLAKSGLADKIPGGLGSLLD